MSFAQLQQAIFDALSGDAGLTAQLSTAWGEAAIFSDVPQENASDAAYYPFISFGGDYGTPLADKDVTGDNVVSQIDIWTRDGNYTTAKNIAATVRGLLDRQNMVVSGQNHITTSYESSDFSLDPDGSTRRGMLKFRTLLQEA